MFTQSPRRMRKPARLSTARIARARPSEKDIWLTDSDGSRGGGSLMLRVAPSGSRRFYYRHSVGGKTKTVPLGPYAKNHTKGALTLGQARDICRGFAAAHLPPVALQFERTRSDAAP